MTLSNRRLSLEEVLDEFFFSADQPSPAMVLRACDIHPEYREDILEFAALWSSYEMTPEAASVASPSEVPDESVSRLQSFILNRLHELDNNVAQQSDVDAAKKALAALAGGALRRAASASGLGGATLLLQKILTNSIVDIPIKVLENLATHINVTLVALQEALSGNRTISRRYSAQDKPNTPIKESWEQAVRSLAIDENESSRLLSFQTEEE